MFISPEYVGDYSVSIPASDGYSQAEGLLRVLHFTSEELGVGAGHVDPYARKLGQALTRVAIREQGDACVESQQTPFEVATSAAAVPGGWYIGMFRPAGLPRAVEGSAGLTDSIEAYAFAEGEPASRRTGFEVLNHLEAVNAERGLDFCRYVTTAVAHALLLHRGVPHTAAVVIPLHGKRETRSYEYFGLIGAGSVLAPPGSDGALRPGSLLMGNAGEIREHMAINFGIGLVEAPRSDDMIPDAR